MNTTRWITGLGSLLLALVLLAPGSARADVVVYQNGKTISGIIDEGPASAETVTITNETGKLTIPKARIKEIKPESKAQGYMHIGQALVARQELPEALQAFQQAANLEPANTQAQQLLNDVQAKIANQQKMDRGEALAQIDKMSTQALELSRKSEFPKAEAMLKDASKLVPSPEQRVKLKLQLSNMYLAWADERQDKLDAIGAEEKLNLALAANPNNEAVIDRMLKIWENDPQKREQTTNIYETILERHPEDKALRKKLGDLYYDMGRTEDAVHHYLELYKSSDQYKGSQIEQRLIELLRKTHLGYARKGDYDKAIQYFNLLASIDPDTNPTDVMFYEFYKKLKTLDPKDAAGRLALTRQAEQQGMDQEALDLFKQLLANPKTKVEAQAGIDRYADKALEGARVQFQNQNYMLAATLADQVRANFPTSQKVVDAAVQLIGQAQAQARLEQRQKAQVARDVVLRADQFYEKAWFHVSNMTNTQRKNVPGLYSDRTMAKQYLQYAVDAYQEALRIDPTLGTQSESLVNVRLKECRNLLSQLSQGPPALPYNYGTPMRDPQSSLNSHF